MNWYDHALAALQAELDARECRRLDKAEDLRRMLAEALDALAISLPVSDYPHEARPRICDLRAEHPECFGQVPRYRFTLAVSESDGHISVWCRKSCDGCEDTLPTLIESAADLGRVIQECPAW